MVGGGRSKSWSSPTEHQYATTMENWPRSRKVSMDDIRKAPVRKSCVHAMIGSPFLAEMMLRTVDISVCASERASSVCTRWMFISSPSKSALYGAQQHSLKRSVRCGSTRARCVIMLRRWSDGWRLKMM